MPENLVPTRVVAAYTGEAVSKGTMENFCNASCAGHNTDVACIVIFNPNFDRVKMSSVLT